MTRKRWYGSVNNRIMEDDGGPEPVVGMGATILMHSDRHACTIVTVHSPKRITIQRDTAVRTDTFGMSDSQNYAYTPNPAGQLYLVTKRPDGRWKLHKDEAKTVVALGIRDEHYDYSF